MMISLVMNKKSVSTRAIVNMLVMVFTLASIIIIFATYLYPLSEREKWSLHI